MKIYLFLNFNCFSSNILKYEIIKIIEKMII